MRIGGFKFIALVYGNGSGSGALVWHERTHLALNIQRVCGISHWLTHSSSARKQPSPDTGMKPVVVGEQPIAFCIEDGCTEMATEIRIYLK